MKVDQEISAEHDIVWLLVFQKIGRDEIPPPESNQGRDRVLQSPKSIVFSAIEVGDAVPRILLAERSCAEYRGLRGLQCTLAHVHRIHDE